VIVGREEELARLTAFVTDAAGWPAALTLEGETGVGKTTLWERTIDTAAERGITVLIARPAEPDAELAFATLSDVLRPILAPFRDALPEPQRSAIAAAMLEEEAGPDTRWAAVSAGTLSLLRTAVDRQPVLVAIDDAQWVDPSTGRALGFALRRLRDRPLGVLLAIRASTEPPRELQRAIRELGGSLLSLGPLSSEDIGLVLTEVLGERPTRRTLAEIHAQSGGNPFFAVELARAARRGDDRPTGLSIPVPRTLREDLVRQRFAGLSTASVETVLTAAASARPTVGLLQTVLPSMRVDEALDQATKNGILRVGRGEVRFTHPLYRSAIYADASRAHRHRIHAAIASAVDDPEERGHHLALSIDVPDPDVAEEIERAASNAAARGAPETSADLLEHAIRLTPTNDIASLARRLLAAGESRFRAGEVERGLSDTLRAADLAEPGSARAHAWARLGSMELFAWRLAEARRHLEAAADEATDDDLRCRVHADLFWTSLFLGDTSAADDHAARGLTLSDGLTDRSARARAYGAAARAHLLRTNTLAVDLRSNAPELWEPIDELPVREWPRCTLLDELVVVGDIAGARDLAVDLLRWAEDHGDEGSRQILLSRLASIDAQRGDWAGALATARDACESAEHAGVAFDEVAQLAWLEAATGNEHEARAHAERTLERAAETGNVAGRTLALSALAMLDLSLGAPSTSLEHLGDLQSSAPTSRSDEPNAWRYVPDGAEALVMVGRGADAEALVAWLEERSATFGHPAMLALAERCRGLVLAAAGDGNAAQERFERAIEHHAREASPYELARTLLAQGRVLRGMGRKRVARQALQRSREIFEDLGAPLWVGRVDDELGRITGRRPSMGELSDAERRVARLAAAGARNREIAAQLFMSVRTVEGHLSSVYAKLGIRSRTELAVFFDDVSGAGG
jgi:DNA-binding CsgD family transcriptional regulator